MTRHSWSQHAYLHVVHKPIDDAAVDMVAEELDFPPSLRDFYRVCNGGGLFCASAVCIGLYLCGCWRPGQTFNRSVEADRPPINIAEENRLRRPDHVVFGAYGFDASLLLIDRRTETVTCCHGRDTSRIRRSWSSIDEWRELEIERMRQYFSPDGRLLAECEDLVPAVGH